MRKRKYCLGGFELPLDLQGVRSVRVTDAKGRFVRRFRSIAKAQDFIDRHNQ